MNEKKYILAFNASPAPGSTENITREQACEIVSSLEGPAAIHQQNQSVAASQDQDAGHLDNATAPGTDIQIYVETRDGNDQGYLHADAAARVFGGHTMVPLRALAQMLGYEVSYSASSGIINIGSGGTVIELASQSALARVNGEECLLDVPPAIINNRVLVPLRFISEGLGYSVAYQPAYVGTLVFVLPDKLVPREEVYSVMDQPDAFIDTSSHPNAPYQTYELKPGYVTKYGVSLGMDIGEVTATYGMPWKPGPDELSVNYDGELRYRSTLTPYSGNSAGIVMKFNDGKLTSYQGYFGFA